VREGGQGRSKSVESFLSVVIGSASSMEWPTVRGEVKIS